MFLVSFSLSWQRKGRKESRAEKIAPAPEDRGLGCRFSAG